MEDRYKIDIHNQEGDYEIALRALKEDKSVLQKNKELILIFLRDCELGKTIKNREKKKIGAGRCCKYLRILKQFSGWVKKPFDKLAQKDMEKFILNLEKNRLKKKNGSNLSEETKVDIKKTIKKFYKWLYGNNRHYPELVDWFDTYVKIKEVPALSRDEVQNIIEQTSSVRNKAIIMVLFDSGARAEEFLNLRLRDLVRKEDYFMIRILYSKTKPRTISLPLCTKYLEDWLNEYPDKNNPEVQLFPVTYDGLRMLIKRIGRKALKKNVYPHLLRHSSATYYCNKLTQFQLCYRYGWTMSSKQPARYIDREGIQEQETAKVVKADEINRFREENQILNEKTTRLESENKEIWRWLERLAFIVKVSSRAANKDKKFELKLKKAIKEMLPEEVVYPLKK